MRCVIARHAAAVSASILAALGLPLESAPRAAAETIVVRGGVVHTMAGPPIVDGVVVIEEGTIRAVGPADRTPAPANARV